MLSRTAVKKIKYSIIIDASAASRTDVFKRYSGKAFVSDCSCTGRAMVEELKIIGVVNICGASIEDNTRSEETYRS